MSWNFRILMLFAEESAVGDAIYYLSESLRKEAVELDQYLKVSFKLHFYPMNYFAYGPVFVIGYVVY